MPNFFTKSENDQNHHLAQKHSALKIDATLKRNLCYQEFPGYYTLLQHKNTQHGFPIKSANDVPEGVINEVDDANLKKELCSCQQFPVDCELERVRHKVFNNAIDNLKAKILNEKLGHYFNNLKWAAKANLTYGFTLKNLEVGGFIYFNAHENNTIMDWSKLVCTTVNWAKLKDFLNKTDVIESCSRERKNTKWKFYKLTNLTLFAALLKEVPMGCKDTVLPEPLLKNHTINCLTYEENTRRP